MDLPPSCSTWKKISGPPLWLKRVRVTAQYLIIQHCPSALTALSNSEPVGELSERDYATLLLRKTLQNRTRSQPIHLYLGLFSFRESARYISFSTDC